MTTENTKIKAEREAQEMQSLENDIEVRLDKLEAKFLLYDIKYGVSKEPPRSIIHTFDIIRGIFGELKHEARYGNQPGPLKFPKQPARRD